MTSSDGFSSLVAAWYVETMSFTVCFLSPHTVCVCVCNLFVTPLMKSTNFCSRYLIEGFSEWDEIWLFDRRGLAVYQGQDW